VFKFTASLILLFQIMTSSLHVHVVDENYLPQAGVSVHLELYEFVSDEEGMVATVVFSEDCITDTSGDCVIEVGETSGVLRGRLDVEGYGSRDVLWPGGVLELPVRLDRVNPGTEAQPYDFLEEDGGVPVSRESFPWISITCVLLLVGGLVAVIYLRSRKEHAPQPKGARQA